MPTIAELTLRRDRLLERFESLQRRVSHGDKVLEFDLTQAKTALELLDKEIARADDRRVIRHLRIRSEKDL